MWHYVWVVADEVKCSYVIIMSKGLRDMTLPVELNALQTQLSRPVATQYSCILLNFFRP